jgi:hypothetical protein
MNVTEHGAYIEEMDSLRVENFGDFVRFVDEHGALIILSKDVIRSLYGFLMIFDEEHLQTEGGNT